jgi:2-aminoadipate transaminase
VNTLWEQRFARRMGGVTSSAIRELFKAVQQPGMISFGGGMPAPEMLPTEAFAEASQRVLSKRGQQALQYGSTEGYPPLRAWIVEYMARQGVVLDEGNVLIVTGAQQGLDLAARLLLNPGDRVVVESPTFLGALQAFNAYQVGYTTVPLDEDGLQVELLEDALEAGPCFIYTVPTFHNPAGVTLSPERRRILIELAARAGVPILEDDPYCQLRYEGEHLPSLLALDAARFQPGDDQGNVIYLGSFSKLLGPGLRLGWVIAPTVVIRRMVQAKQGIDLHTSLYVQMVVHEVVQGDFLERHVARLRAVYRKRRDVMLAAMARHFPPGVSWTRPQGGLFLWVTLPPSLSADELLEEALRHRVAFVPGAPFYAEENGSHALRLNFSYAQPEQIETGIQRLGEVLAQALERDDA